ncbi:MAG TPA: MFS transporter [Metalysinibacillus sp.]
MNETSKKIQWTGSTIILVLGIALIASTLRTPLTVVGPIIAFIKDGLQISNVLAGFLTTIPLLAFAVVSPFAPKLSKRFGIELTLFLSMLLLALGIIMRSLGTTSLLVIGTILIGVAISFGNVLMPSFLKLKFPMQVGMMMGIYSVAMNVSGGLGAGISHPIAAGTSLGWQAALGFSVGLAILAALVWSPQLKHNKPAPKSTQTTLKPTIPLWKSPIAWAVAATMGLQSMIFYTSSAWLPEIFISQGLTANKAGWMVSIMQLAQLPLTFAIPIIADKLTSQKPLAILASALFTVGFLGIALEFTSLTVLWMIFLGCAGGTAFGLTMMLFTLRTKTAFAAADLSGFAQSTGYLLAAIGPVAFGYLHDVTGGWTIPVWTFLLATLALFLTSYIASKNVFIDEQV